MAIPKMDFLVDLREYMAGYNVILAGTFEKEFKRLAEVTAIANKALDEATEGQGISQVRATADAYVKASQERSEALLKDVAISQEKVNKDKEEYASLIVQKKLDKVSFEAEKTAILDNIKTEQLAIQVSLKEAKQAEVAIKQIKADVTALLGSLKDKEAILDGKLALIKSLG